MSKPLDEVDRRIIDQLQEEGRRPFTRIARDVGVSEANVRQRVAALTERGVIQIVAATSPIALGMIQAFISVRLSGAGLEEASERIAAIPEVDYVAVCTGPRTCWSAPSAGTTNTSSRSSRTASGRSRASSRPIPQ